jgi:hypothetical protein
MRTVVLSCIQQADAESVLDMFGVTRVILLAMLRPWLLAGTSLGHM